MREVIVRFENQNVDPAYVVGEPVADIVRCKDCIHMNAFSDCTNPYAIYYKQVADDDFCSRGERKGGTE